MTIQELNNKIIQRLSQRDENVVFAKELDNILQEFLLDCQRLKISKLNEKKERLSKYVEQIVKIVDKYLNGDLFSAFESFKELVHSDTDDSKHNDFIKSQSLESSKILYRIRAKGEEKTFTRKDIFHVPFSLREKVTTNRFSIPGFPCLYLGTSILTCWEELHRPALSNFYVAGFKLKKKINLLDLRFSDSFDDEDDLCAYIMMLPLIIACTIKRQNFESVFSSEYIFPQILLHRFLQDKKNIDGFLFTSSDYASTDMNKNISLYDNVVIPVKEVNEIGYCPKLCKMFSLSNPFDFESEMIKGSFMNQMVKSETEMDYGHTLFGVMESIINKDEYRSITPKGDEIK